jgi:ABC-type polysaccharide/polyol phosphate transport system ATPase subunit
MFVFVDLCFKFQAYYSTFGISLQSNMAQYRLEILAEKGIMENMDKNIAIEVKNVSKTFKIPHEKIRSLRGAFVNLLKKKTYEEFEALKDVSFEVKKGEFFGIIGKNGSGKSTLLKILAGIYPLDKGKMHIDGRISPFLELGIGFNPELSGRDNIYLNAIVLGMTRKQVDKKFDEIVAFSELEKFIDQKLSHYSSGMEVRLAFSVAIHANREILLMDEVLAVGDINFQKKCFDYFMEIKGKKTVLFVSHDLENMRKFCDRSMLIMNGKIEYVGDTADAVGKYEEMMKNVK